MFDEDIAIAARVGCERGDGPARRAWLSTLDESPQASQIWEPSRRPYIEEAVRSFGIIRFLTNLGYGSVRRRTELKIRHSMDPSRGRSLL